MPYSDFAVKDRQAVAQLRYQIRRFIRQMKESGVDKIDIDRITHSLHAALNDASGIIDFYDDGTRMEMPKEPF